jgi:hypothetical protein
VAIAENAPKPTQTLVKSLGKRQGSVPAHKAKETAAHTANAGISVVPNSVPVASSMSVAEDAPVSTLDTEQQYPHFA